MKYLLFAILLTGCLLTPETETEIVVKKETVEVIVVVKDTIYVPVSNITLPGAPTIISCDDDALRFTMVYGAKDYKLYYSRNDVLGPYIKKFTYSKYEHNNNMVYTYSSGSADKIFFRVVAVNNDGVEGPMSVHCMVVS